MTSGMENDPRDTATGANGAPQTQLQETATGLIDQATRTAEAQASTTMTRVGETLQGVATAIRDSSMELRESQPDVANLIGTAAERVEQAGVYLRDHGAADVVEQVQQAARRQPAMVIGGGLVAGLVLGRLLRSGTAAVAEPQGSGRYGWQDDDASRSYGYGAADPAGMHDTVTADVAVIVDEEPLIVTDEPAATTWSRSRSSGRSRSTASDTTSEGS
jgi:hypothetical protein